MEFYIKIARYNVDKCPHCGKPIKGTRQDWTESDGFVWRDFLKEVGYYVPYEIREKDPERDFYGKDMTLTTEQAKSLAAFARDHDVYGWGSIKILVDCAIENGDFVVINADW